LCSLRPIELYYFESNDSHKHPERQASSRMDQAEELTSNADFAIGISDDDIFMYCLVNGKIIVKDCSDNRTLEEKFSRLFLGEY